MAEKRMTVDLIWDDEAGRDWMNIYNLELLLYSSQATRRDLLRAELIETDQVEGDRNESDDDTPDITMRHTEKPLDKDR